MMNKNVKTSLVGTTVRILLITAIKTGEVCIAVAGLTYFWKEMFTPAFNEGNLTYMALPAIVLAATVFQLTRK